MGLGFEFEMIGGKEKKTTEGAGSLKFSFSFFLFTVIVIVIIICFFGITQSKQSKHTYIHTCNYVC